jgi:hypothetical protein
VAHDVFISYSTRNKLVADAICAGLEARRIRCWIAPRDVLPGRNYGESIVEAIASAQVMVLVFSKETNLSQAVVREAERAMHHNKPIIPFRIDDSPMAAGLEFFLASCHWLDAITPPLETHLATLAGAVERLLGREGNPSPELPAGASARVGESAPQMRPRKRVFTLLALLALLGLVGLFILWGITPSLHEESADSAPSVSLNVSVAGAGSGAIQAAFSSHATPRYEAYAENDSVIVQLTNLPQPGEVLIVAPTSAGDWVEIPPLVLEVKTLNQGERTLFFQRVVFEVAQVVPRTGPAWMIDGTKLPKRLVFQAFGGRDEVPPQVALGVAGPDAALEMSVLDEPSAATFLGADTWEMIIPNGESDPGERTLFGTIDGLPFEIPLKQSKQSPRPGQSDSFAPIYQLEVPDLPAPFQMGCDISQYVQPGEGDRFFVQLATDCIPTAAEYEIQFFLEFDDGFAGLQKVAGPRLFVPLIPTQIAR